jgi:hypothetical protein
MRNLFLVIFITLLSSNVFTCWYDDGNYGYVFFEKQNVSDPTVLYFVNYSTQLGIGYSSMGQKPENTNLNSWKTYLGGDLEDVDVLDVVYKTKTEELKSLLEDKKLLKDQAKDRPVLALWQSNRKLHKAMGNYLIYARSCAEEAQKEVVYWDENSRRNQKTIQQLIEEGTLAYKKEKDEFIKDRYAFQLIRLAFYMEDFDGALRLFREYFPEEKDNPSYIYYRALELKAGVLHRQGEPEAPYLFAKVFANCPDRRESCLNSFSFTNNNDWERAMSLCKRPEEKVVFYAMRGLQPTANPVEEIANILEVDPASPYAELLFCRYITDVQQRVFPHYYENYQPYPREDVAASAQLKELRNLSQRMLNNAEQQNADFWMLAAAYLELIHKNFGAAMEYCTNVPESSDYYDQSRVIRFVAQLCAVERIDNETADAIWAAYLEDEALSNNYNVQAFVEDVLAMLYYKQADYAKAFLAQNDLWTLRGRLDLQLLKDLERFVKTSSKNPGLYERYLLEKRSGGEEALDHILQMQGVYYLQHNQLTKAIDVFEKISVKHQRNDAYFNNPYLSKTIWVESIDQPIFYKDVSGQQNVRKLYEEYEVINQDYNLLSFTEKLLELEQLARKEDQNMAEYYYLLGIAWYNISPAAWSRPAIYYAQNNGGHSNWFSTGTKEVRPKTFHNYGWNNYRYFNPDVGTSYFERAIKFTEDPELAARACYMAAKMEKARYHTAFWWNKNEVNMSKYNEYLDRLKADYSNTQYYQEVIEECTVVRARN